MKSEFHKLPWFYLPLWLLLVLVTAFFSEGWLQPDEHARVLEAAHHLVYGYSSIPWELSQTPAIVSWFLGVLMAPVFFATNVLGLSGTNEAFVARFCVGVIASTRLLALLQIFSILGLKKSRNHLYLIISSLALFGPFLYVRTSQENFATTALIWAFVYQLKVIKMPESRKDLFLFCFLIAIATSFRLQLGPTAAVMGLYTMFLTGPKIIPISCLGLVCGLMPLGLVDFVTTGTPFLPAWSYLQYALGGEEGGSVWGTNPWWFYFAQYFETWYPPIGILLLPILLLGVYVCKPVGLIILSFTAVHCLIGHKETRYFYPIIPFFHLATFLGFEYLETRHHWYIEALQRKMSLFRASLAIFIFIGIAAGFFSLNTSPRMYDALGALIRSERIQSFTYIGNTRSPPSALYLKAPSDTVDFKQYSTDEFRQGELTAVGWLVLYCLDPSDFAKIEAQCQTEYVSLSRFELRLLSLLPLQTPIRRRVNAIVWCDKTPDI